MTKVKEIACSVLSRLTKVVTTSVKIVEGLIGEADDVVTAKTT